MTYRKNIIDKARSCAAFHKLPGPLISNGGLSEYCGSSMTRMLSLMLRCACARHQLALCRAHGCERPVAGSSTNTLRSSVLTSPLPTTSTRHCQRTLMSEKELLLSRAWRQDSRRTCITPACTRLLAVGCTTSSSNWPSRDASTASGSSTLPPKAYWQAAKSCPQCAFIRWPNAMPKRDGGLALLPYLNVWGCGGNRQSDVETRSRVELPGASRKTIPDELSAARHCSARGARGIQERRATPLLLLHRIAPTIRFETDSSSTARPRHVGRPASRFAASSQGVGRTHAHSDRVSRFSLTVRPRCVGWSGARPREGDQDELRLVTRQRGARMPPTARVASSCSACGRAARAARPTLTVRPRCVDGRSS